MAYITGDGVLEITVAGGGGDETVWCNEEVDGTVMLDVLTLCLQ